MIFKIGYFARARKTDHSVLGYDIYKFHEMGGTEVENFAIGVVKGSVFRSETCVGLGFINIIIFWFTLLVIFTVFCWVRVSVLLQNMYNLSGCWFRYYKGGVKKGWDNLPHASLALLLFFFKILVIFSFFCCDLGAFLTFF